MATGARADEEGSGGVSLGRMTSWSSTPAGQRITLCMIVRDEEATLGQCLSSVSRWVDEIVVVDTGSSDGTIAVAESHGARVGHFAWCDNFALARNASLSLATGDWIMVLDADETLEPLRARFIRELVAEGRGPETRPRVYTMVVRSETAHGVTDDLQIRLWQHGAGLEFAGRIHESLVAPTGSALGVMPTNSVLVNHTGYQPSMMEARDKVRRNGMLLETAIVADPDDAYLFYKQAQHLVTDGDYAGAVSSAERALELSASGRASRGALGGSNVADTYRTLIAAHLSLSDVSAAVAAGERGTAACPDHPPLWTQFGLAVLGAGAPDRALLAFQEARSRRDMPVVGAIDRGSAGWRALYGMGEAYLELKRPADARASLAQALIDAPTQPLIIRALATAEEQMGHTQAAYDRLDAAVRRIPGDVALRRALSGLLRRAGETTGAVNALAPLLDLPQVPPEVYDDLADALESAGSAEDSANARSIARLLRELPADPVDEASRA